MALWRLALRSLVTCFLCLMPSFHILESVVKLAVINIFLFTPLLASAVNVPPPVAIPKQLYNAFTYYGLIPVVYLYRNDSRSSDQPIIYDPAQVDFFISKAEAKQVMYYGMTDVYLYQALDKYIDCIAGKNVAVMGSEIPWYESILLAYGAKPTTIEYNKIISTDPRLEIFTVDEYEANPKTFDAVLSISSFEHDGLGRYGDPVNPIGDLIAMGKTKKMLNDDGLLFLAVPVGQDCLVWNLHRVYGKLRLKALLQGWRILGYFGFSSENLEQDAWAQAHQPVFVLKPIK